MTSDRIKEIQEQTAYPESVSVMLALEQVWNECEQEQLAIQRVSESVCPNCGNTGRCEPRTLSDPDGQECDCGANCC